MFLLLKRRGGNGERQDLNDSTINKNTAAVLEAGQC